MRIQRLQLENFRGFRSLDLDLSTGNTTVLVGVNGAGKSSILDALSIALAEFAAKLQAHDNAGYRKIELMDVRAGETRASIRVELTVDAPNGARREPHRGVLHISRGDPGFESQSHAVNNFMGEQWFHHWRGRLHADRRTIAPAIGCYPTERFVDSEIDEFAPPALPSQPTQLYAKIFGRRVDFQEFVHWFRSREDYENEMIRESRAYVDPQLQAVRRAIASFMPGYDDLRVRRVRPPGVDDLAAWPDEGPILVLRKGDTLLRLSQLSHGEQGLLAMVGDIARRLAVTHPALEDPLHGSGVVLIDEIELHLHPKWQREIVPTLEATFPDIQFIITTHSPQVLSRVPGERVKRIEDFELVVESPHTHGRDSNSILWEVMGVPRHPRFAAAQLERISELIDREQWSEADAKLDALEHQWGSGDADIRRLRSMLAFLRAEAG